MASDVAMFWHFIWIFRLCRNVPIQLFFQDADDDGIGIDLMSQCPLTSLAQAFLTHFALKAQDSCTGFISLLWMRFGFKYRFNKFFDHCINSLCFTNKLLG